MTDITGSPNQTNVMTSSSTDAVDNSLTTGQPRDTFTSRTSPVIGSSYGGLGSYGLGSGGMGMGMGSMGMGLGGYGGMNMMGRRGMQPGQSQINQSTQQMFYGMRSLIQMGFATFGMVTYGKIFIEMVKNACGWSYRTVMWLFKKILSTFVFNKVTTKIMSGLFRGNIQSSVSGGNRSFGDFFFRGLMTTALMGLGWMCYMYKQNSLSEYEHLLEETIRRRKLEREHKQREFEIEYQRALDQAQKELEEYNLQSKLSMEEAFQETRRLDVMNDSDDDAPDQDDENSSAKRTQHFLDDEQNDQEDSKAAKSEDQKPAEINEEEMKDEMKTAKKEESGNESDEGDEKSEPQFKSRQSEEFWDYNKKIEEKLKCHEDGEALNNLFEDKEELQKIQQEKLEKEKARQHEEIMQRWASIPTFKKSNTLPLPSENPKDTDATNQSDVPEPQINNIAAEETRVDQEIQSTPFSAVITSQFTPPAKKPWLR